jgi:hypothetical protein
MQRAKASIWVLADPAPPTDPAAFADPSAFAEPPEPVDDELPPHAAASSTTPAVTARTPARGGHARCQRPRPPVSFIMPSSGARWLQVYARAGDISATGDVARMSCRPTHNGGMRMLVVGEYQL